MSNSPGVPFELKPMSLSELLDRTFTLYRSNFWLFCGLMAMPQVVIAAISIAFYFNPSTRTIPNVQPNPSDPFAPLEALAPILLATLILSVLITIVYAVAVSAVTFAVSGLCLGRPVSIRKSYAMLLKRFFGLLGLILILLFIGFVFLLAGFLAGTIVGGIVGALLNFVTPILGGLFIFLAMAVGFVLGFWLIMRFAVSIPVFLLEGRGVFDSLARSGVLTKGHRWRILVATLVMTAIVFVIRLLFLLPFTISGLMYPSRVLIPLWQQAGMSIAGALSGTLVGSLLTIMVVLIYYDVRIRKEAFDLEAMMAALGQPGVAPAPSSAPLPPQQAL
ncbi:MAG: hypothetical protein WB997_04585 [Candidatus Acidiferrales bacterium]